MDLSDDAMLTSIMDIITNKEAIAVNQQWAGPSITNHKSNWRNIWHLDVRCVLLSAPSTLGAGGPNQHTSRIQHKDV